LLFCLLCTRSHSQQSLDSLLTKIDPQKWSASVEKKLGKLEDKIIAKSEKTLHRLEKQEEKIYRKQLTTKDSLEAKTKLAEIQSKYGQLKDRLNNPSSVLPNSARQYIGHLDTLKTAFNFLDQSKGSREVKDALSKIKSFEGKMNEADVPRKFIKQRKQQLQKELEPCLVKDLKKFNKQAYYIVIYHHKKNSLTLNYLLCQNSN